MISVDPTQYLGALEAADDDQLPGALGEFLRRVAEYAGADRASVAVGADSNSGQGWRFEYVAPGLQPTPPASEVERPSGPRAAPLGVVCAPRVSELPPDLGHLRARYERARVQSAITATIRDGADPIGQLEVQAIRRERRWGHVLADEVASLAAGLLPTVQRLARLSSRVDGHGRAYVYLAPAADLARALDLAERRYAAIADDSGQLCGCVSPDLRVTHVNGPSCAYTGMAREGLLRLPLSDVVHPDDYGALVAALRALTPTEPCATLEFRAYSPRDGEYRWHRATCRALFDLDGQLVEYQAVGSDITRQVRVAGDVVREIGHRPELSGRLRLLEALLRLMEKAHGIAAEEALARVHGPDNPLPVLVLRLVRSALSGTWDEEAEAGIRGLAKARRAVGELLEIGQGENGKALAGEPIDLASCRQEREAHGS